MENCGKQVAIVIRTEENVLFDRRGKDPWKKILSSSAWSESVDEETYKAPVERNRRIHVSVFYHRNEKSRRTTFARGNSIDLIPPEIIRREAEWKMNELFPIPPVRWCKSDHQAEHRTWCSSRQMNRPTHDERSKMETRSQFLTIYFVPVCSC